MEGTTVQIEFAKGVKRRFAPMRRRMNQTFSGFRRRPMRGRRMRMRGRGRRSMSMGPLRRRRDMRGGPRREGRGNRRRMVFKNSLGRKRRQ